jgi:hypothetical protein
MTRLLLAVFLLPERADRLISALKAARVTHAAFFVNPGFLEGAERAAQGTLTEALAWEKGLAPPRWHGRNDTKLASHLFAERVLKETR